VATYFAESRIDITPDMWRNAMDHLYSHGVTSMTLMENERGMERIKTFKMLPSYGHSVDLRAFIMANTWEEGLAGALRRRAVRDVMVEVLGVKIFLDGSLGSSTAWTLEPYVGGPAPELEGFDVGVDAVDAGVPFGEQGQMPGAAEGHSHPHGDIDSKAALAAATPAGAAHSHGGAAGGDEDGEALSCNCNHGGTPLMTIESLRKAVRSIHDAGLAVAAHAIGDAAADIAVRALIEEVSPDGPPRSALSRIEHFQLVSDLTMEYARAATDPKTAIMFSMQPCQMIADTAIAGSKWGKERMMRCYRLRSAHEAGIHQVRFGSDAPVEPVLPMRNVVAAETVWNPKERLDRETTLAYSTHRGTLQVREGDPCDLALWTPALIEDRSHSEAFIDLRTLLTIHHGDIVHESAEIAAST
jgi:predicted amidohydrolase YtcJ